ncbi:MAG: protein kinase [Cystobacter sp.]
MLPTAQDDVRGRQMGNYEVLCRLSTGGMAEIFLASRKGLAGFHKPVVLKKILPDIQGQEEFVQMFLDEARVTAAFNHPNIAQVFDLDVARDELFLAMEFVPGATLLEVARACLTAREPMPMGFALAAVRDTALALHYAHTFTDSLGEPSPVIHRDVAEKNIMVTYEGVTKLLDFGIAKSLAEAGRTQVGMVKGTSGYMSPEQIRGQPLDARSDLFSLGVVLHECLTGARLFPGKSPAAVVSAVLRDPIPEPSRSNRAIPPALDALVLKALARQREDRYTTALEFARELERAVGPLIWLPEQSGELLRRLFAERRDQTRQMLAGSRTGTGEVKLSTPPAESRDTTPAPSPRLPTVTAAPPQSSRGPSSDTTDVVDIVPYSPLAKPPSASPAGETRALSSARTPPRPSPERGRPAAPPRTRTPGRDDAAASEERESEKTAVVRPRRSTSAESRAVTPDAPSSRSLPTRPIRTSAPDASARASLSASPPEPGPSFSDGEATRPNRRLPLPPLPHEDVEEGSAEYATLPYQTLGTSSSRRQALTEEELLVTSGTHSLSSTGGRRRWLTVLMVGVVGLGVAAALILFRLDGGLVSSWLFSAAPASAPQPTPASPAPTPSQAAPVPAPEATRAAPVPVPAPPPAEPKPETLAAPLPAAEPTPSPAAVEPATPTDTPSTGAPVEASAEPVAGPGASEGTSAMPPVSAESTAAEPARAALVPSPRSRKEPAPAPKAAAEPTPDPAAREGSLTLVTAEYARVFLAGRLLGETPLFQLKLPAGRHTLRLIGPDKKAVSLVVEITPGADTEMRGSLANLTQKK